MVNSEPDIPEDSEPESTAERLSHTSDYLTGKVSTEQAFQEIISELSDLSTDRPIVETPRTDDTDFGFDFPTAPWVSGSSVPSSVAVGTGPRDWEDDLETVKTIDDFEQPDPDFALSKDPARNLGWLLTIFPLLCGLILFVTTGKTHAPTFMILGVLFLCGVGLLVWRLPQEKSPLDGDFGAQV